MSENQNIEREVDYDPLAFDGNWGNDKVKDAKKILRADFIDVSGNSKEEMILLLIDKIRAKVNVSS